MKQYLVLDIGGTFIKYALMGEDGSFLEHDKVPSKTDCMENMLAPLDTLYEKYQGQYEGVAVSMPGRIDTKKGIAHTGGSFTFIQDAPMAEYFEQRLHAPVTIANDGKCAASAEAWSGALADVDNGAVLVLGTGIGGGIVLDKKVWMGNTFGAGELSMLPADFKLLSEGLTAANGIRSLWTNYASATGLVNLYAEKKGLPRSTHGLDGIALFQAYDAGEPEAAEALELFGNYVAAGIYAVQSVLDVQRFAIGGGISARPEVTATIRACVDRQFALVPITPFSKPEIVQCKYGNDANLIGALSFHLAGKNK